MSIWIEDFRTTARTADIDFSGLHARKTPSLSNTRTHGFTRTHKADTRARAHIEAHARSYTPELTIIQFVLNWHKSD